MDIQYTKVFCGQGGIIVDAVSQKRTGKKRMTRPKRIAQKAAGRQSKDTRRLIQLIVSLMLFLVVFLGRNANSGRIDGLDASIGTDVDFRTAFQSFGQAVTEGSNLSAALRKLGLTMLGQSIEDTPIATVSPVQVPKVTPLIETGRFGLDQAKGYGVMKFLPARTEPTVEPAPEPAPTPQVVTAIAQTYGENGEALPTNVSFQYYELGLEKTVIPVNGEITSGFGYRKSPTSGKREFHLAMDIAADEGTAIAAFADGVVRYIGESEEFGLYFMLDHANNVSTFYAHCSKLLVRKGESVTCGQTVALVGSTGNVTGAHLHLTILKDSIRLNPAHYVDL